MRSLPVFILTRLASVVVVVVSVAVVTFLMLHVLRPEAWPLDPRPLHVELGDYLQRVFLHLDFGTSWDRRQTPVWQMLEKGVPADVSLLVGGLVIGSVAGMAGGAFCATHPRSPVTRVLQALAAFFLIAPVYWVGLMLILAFGAEFGVVPIPFFRTNVYAHVWEDPGAWLQALVVPWFVLGAPLAALCLRMTRATMTEVLDEDYLRTARAKGLTSGAVARRHALPAASSPVLTLIGVNMATLLTNIVLIEHAFSIPGVFRLTTEAMSDGNFPLLQGMTIVGAVLVVVANLAVDVVHALVDPRVRLRPSG
jgi:peptide/nickel transport system permease protein